MKKIAIVLGIMFLLVIFIIAYGITQKNEKSPKPSIILITTDYGTIKIKLYNETPIHRDNFTTLVEQGFYNGLLFHRVIKGFMIQGGDPDSKKAKQGEMLGNGGPGYTLPAEINPKFFHKRGAIAAARLGDDQNPNRESSGSQFYIVQGTVFSNGKLDTMQMNLSEKLKYDVIMSYFQDKNNIDDKRRLDELKKSKDISGINNLVKEIEIKLTKENKIPVFKFTDEQRKAYSTIGGAPHLDGAYTVFGEVIEGMDVVDKIASLQVDKYSRPLQDVKMSMKIIK